MEKFFQGECEDIILFRKITEEVLDDLIAVGRIEKGTSISMSSSDYMALIAELKKLLKSIDFNASQMRDSLMDYDSAKVNCFIEAVNERRMILVSRSITDHNSAYGDIMTDFDWRLKLILGTSTYNELQYPILELGMQTVNTHNGVATKNFELSKVELGKLISSLEKSL